MENRPADRQVERIVKQAQAGDQSAFAELYEMYYDPIYRYVSFKCGNRIEAEDLSGEVFVKMIESIHTFQVQGLSIYVMAVQDSPQRRGG